MDRQVSRLTDPVETIKHNLEMVKELLKGENGEYYQNRGSKWALIKNVFLQSEKMVKAVPFDNCVQKEETTEQNKILELLDDIENNLKSVEINIKFAEARKFNNYLKFLAKSISDFIPDFATITKEEAKEYFPRLKQLKEKSIQILDQADDILQEMSMVSNGEISQEKEKEDKQKKYLEDLKTIETGINAVHTELKYSNVTVVKDVVDNFKRSLSHIKEINQKINQKKSEILDLIKNTEETCNDLDIDNKLNEAEHKYENLKKKCSDGGDMQIQYIKEFEELEDFVTKIPTKRKFEERKKKIWKQINADLKILNLLIEGPQNVSKTRLKRQNTVFAKQQNEEREKQIREIENMRLEMTELVTKGLNEAEQQHIHLIKMYETANLDEKYKQELLFLKESVDQFQETDRITSEKKKYLSFNINNNLKILEVKFSEISNQQGGATLIKQNEDQVAAQIIEEVEGNIALIQLDILDFISLKSTKKNCELNQKLRKNAQILYDLEIDKNHECYKIKIKLLREIQTYANLLGDKIPNVSDEIQELQEEIQQLEEKIETFDGYCGDSDFNVLDEEIYHLECKLNKIDDSQLFGEFKESYIKDIDNLLRKLLKKCQYNLMSLQM